MQVSIYCLIHQLAPLFNSHTHDRRVIMTLLSLFVLVQEKKNWYILFRGSTKFSLLLLLFCILHQDQIRVHARALPAEMRACAFNCSLVSYYWPRDCFLSRQRISLTYTSTLCRSNAINGIIVRKIERYKHSFLFLLLSRSLLIWLESSTLVRWTR
jgi:hypothetical protein